MIEVGVFIGLYGLLAGASYWLTRPLSRHTEIVYMTADMRVIYHEIITENRNFKIYVN